MTEQSTNYPEDAPKRLILDLTGPFVVHFYNGEARIHAPLCVDHHANVLTDSNDISLDGLQAPAPPDGYPKGFIYNLDGPAGHAGKFDCLRSGRCATPEQLLILNKLIEPIDPSGCHLVLHAPSPDNIVPLLTEQIWIHENGPGIFVNTVDKDPSIVNEPRARGLRFIYSDCPKTPSVTLLQHPESSGEAVESDLEDLNSNALGYDPPQYHITLRFASNDTASDEDHEDAYNCFQEMRTLISGASRWRVDFSDSTDPVVLKRESIDLFHHGGTNPSDCGAAVLVAPDAV